MAAQAPKFQILTVAPAAAARIREIVAASGDGRGVRVGVKNGGCAGMSYTLDLVREADPADDRIEIEGATVFIDPKAVLFLFGTEMDFETTKIKSGFVFHNPNEVSACGCGESVDLRPAELPAGF